MKPFIFYMEKGQACTIMRKSRQSKKKWLLVVVKSQDRIPIIWNFFFYYNMAKITFHSERYQFKPSVPYSLPDLNMKVSSQTKTMGHP